MLQQIGASVRFAVKSSCLEEKFAKKTLNIKSESKIQQKVVNN